MMKMIDQVWELEEEEEEWSFSLVGFAVLVFGAVFVTFWGIFGLAVVAVVVVVALYLMRGGW